MDGATENGLHLSQAQAFTIWWEDENLIKFAPRLRTPSTPLLPSSTRDDRWSIGFSVCSSVKISAVHSIVIGIAKLPMKGPNSVSNRTDETIDILLWRDWPRPRTNTLMPRIASALSVLQVKGCAYSYNPWRPKTRVSPEREPIFFRTLRIQNHTEEPHNLKTIRWLQCRETLETSRIHIVPAAHDL